MNPSVIILTEQQEKDRLAKLALDREVEANKIKSLWGKQVIHSYKSHLAQIDSDRKTLLALAIIGPIISIALLEPFFAGVCAISTILFAVYTHHKSEGHVVIDDYDYPSAISEEWRRLEDRRIFQENDRKAWAQANNLINHELDVVRIERDEYHVDKSPRNPWSANWLYEFKNDA